MSKSLKNFQTIKDALASTYTARSMRIVFLLGRWNEGVEISPDMRTYADNWEAAVNNFFTNTKSLITEASGSLITSATEGDIQSLSINDKRPLDGLFAELEQAKKDFEAALVNSFDTPQAMRTISDIIRKANIHVSEHRTGPDLPAIEAIARWITKIVGIFGLDTNATPPYEGLGWASAAAAANVDPKTSIKPYEEVYNTIISDVKALQLPASDSITDILSRTPQSEFESLASSGVRNPEQLALPYLRSISKLRDELRRIAPTTSSETKISILGLSDRIRDVDLTNLGVYLDDRPDGLPSLVKFVPAAELIAAREEKAAKEAEKARAREEARRAREKDEEEKWAKAKVVPKELFKNDKRFSEWDADGIPIKMNDGSMVTKSQRKKYTKDWEKQRKLHEEWQAKFGGTA